MIIQGYGKFLSCSQIPWPRIVIKRLNDRFNKHVTNNASISNGLLVHIQSHYDGRSLGCHNDDDDI